MAIEIRVSTLVKAVAAFQRSYDHDSEYGVNDEDAASGVIAALAQLDMVSPLTAKRLSREVAKHREREDRKRRAAYRASLSPEERERQDAVAASLRDSSTWFSAQSKVLAKAVADTKDAVTYNILNQDFTHAD